MSKIIRIEEGIETYEERKKFFEDASIYLPSTLKILEAYVLLPMKKK